MLLHDFFNIKKPKVKEDSWHGGGNEPKDAWHSEAGVAEGSTETPQQQQVRTAITKGMEKWDQNGLATYQSQPAKRLYFASSDWSSGQLEGINSIDPDGTVVIELNDTTTAGLVKKLASLGGMPGVKTRQLKATFDPAKANADGVIQATVAEGKADYKIKSIGTDAKGDYYISPSTGKKVYKSGVKVGDHENPKTGEHMKVEGYFSDQDVQNKGRQLAGTQAYHAKKKTEKEKNAAAAKTAFDAKFGGSNPVGTLKIREQGVAEGSEWETRHDEFVTVGDRATPEQINKIVSALGVAAKQASSKRGFLNQIVGKQSNGDLARMAHSAEILAKNIQRNSNAKPGTDERKELGQHLVYALSLLKRMSGEQGVAEAKADPLGAWIAHKNGTDARKFKTREGAKKYIASHEGFTVSSSEAFHDTYRKKKVQEVKKFRSAHAKQVATKRKEYEQGLGNFEPTDNMVGTAKIIKDIAMSDASPEHKKVAIDALNKKGVAEGSRNAYLKHNNLVDLEKPLAGLEDEFNKFLRTHDPEVKQKYQQGIKDRIKTSTMAGPKGVLPEQGMAREGIEQSTAVTQEQLNQLYAKGKPMQFIKNTPVALVPLAQINKIGTPQQVQQVQQALGSVDQTSYTDEYKNKGYVVFQWNGTALDLYVASPEVVAQKYVKFNGQLPQDEKSRGKIPSLVALGKLGIDPSKVPFFVKKVPTPMVPAKQLGLEGKTIQTSWGEQTVSPNGFMVREENGHIYTVAPDAQGLPIGYVPAGQQGVAEGAGDYMNRGAPMPTTPTTPEQVAQMFQGKTGEQIAKEQFLDRATGDKIAAYVAQGPEGCKIVADYLRKMNNPRRTDAVYLEQGVAEGLYLDEGITDFILKSKDKFLRLKNALSNEWAQSKQMWQIVKKGNKATSSEINFANNQFKDILRMVGLAAWYALLPIPGNTLLILGTEKLLNRFGMSIMPDEITNQVLNEKEQGVAEGWKDLAVGGAMALGALGAGHAQAADLSNYNTQYLQQVVSGENQRPLVNIDDAKAELQARTNGKQQSVTTPAKSEEPKGFSKEYLQKASDPNRFGRYLISVEKAQELLSKMQEGVAEGMFTKGPAIDPIIGKQINDIINKLWIRAKQTKDEYLRGTVQELFDILKNTGGTYSVPGSPGVRDMAEAIPLDQLRSAAGTRVKDEVSAQLKQMIAAKNAGQIGTKVSNIDPRSGKESNIKTDKDVAEGKGLAKKVKIVKGPDAGKTGWIREVKHGAFEGAPKTYYIDLDDGGQANNLPATALRLVKEHGVSESLDQPYTLQWYSPPSRDSDEVSYVDAFATLDDNSELEISFTKKGDEVFHSDDRNNWLLEFSRGDSQEVTGGGDEKRIFATVLVAIQEFVKKYNPTTVTFSASKEPAAPRLDSPAGTKVNPGSRAKLYNRMVQRYASAAGYIAQQREGNDKIVYVLRRAKPDVAEGANYWNKLQDTRSKKINSLVDELEKSIK